MQIKNCNNEKECVVCGGTFERIDFPQCFDRMVTCGSPDCEKQRRYEKWRARYLKFKKCGGGK